MEEPQSATEPSQQFENIDFNSSPDDNNKESSNNGDQDQVNSIIKKIIFCHFSKRQSTIKRNCFVLNLSYNFFFRFRLSA